MRSLCSVASAANGVPPPALHHLRAYVPNKLLHLPLKPSCPPSPWPHGPLSIIFIMLKQMISKKELELLGVSSGTGAASGRDVAILDATKDAT